MFSRTLSVLTVFTLFAASAAVADTRTCQPIEAATNVLAQKGASEQAIIAQGVVATNEAAVAKSKQPTGAAGQTFYDKLAGAFQYVSNLDKNIDQAVASGKIKATERVAFKARQKRALYDLINGSGFQIEAFGVYLDTAGATGFLVSIPYDVNQNGDLVQKPTLCIEETLTKVSYMPLVGAVKKLSELTTDKCATSAPKTAFSCASLQKQIETAAKRPEIVVIESQTARKDGEHLLITGGTDSGSIYFWRSDGTAWEQTRLQVFGVQKQGRR